MADPEPYPEIPSPSSQSLRTLEGDAASTPMRTGTPTPIRHVDERSRLLDRSGDDVFVEYRAEQAVERRRKPSTYSVINTGTTSRAGSGAFPTSTDEAVGELSFLIFAPSHSLLKEHIGHARSWTCET